MTRDEVIDDIERIGSSLDQRSLRPPTWVVFSDTPIFSAYDPVHRVENQIEIKRFSDITHAIRERESTFQSLSDSQLEAILGTYRDLMSMPDLRLHSAFARLGGGWIVAHDQVPEYIKVQSGDMIVPGLILHAKHKVFHYGDGFTPNTVAHELAHFLEDFGLLDSDMPNETIHSSDPQFRQLLKWEKVLYSDSVAALVEKIRSIRHTVPESDDQKHSEYFAILSEIYFGNAETRKLASPILESYMERLVGLHLDACLQDKPLPQIEEQRATLSDYFNWGFEEDLENEVGEMLQEYTALKQELSGKPAAVASPLAQRIENKKKVIEERVLGAISSLEEEIRVELQLPMPPSSMANKGGDFARWC